MNPVEHHTTFGHSDSLDDKEERLRRRRERDRARRTAETHEERRGERLQWRRQRDRARRATLSRVERHAHVVTLVRHCADSSLSPSTPSHLKHPLPAALLQYLHQIVNPFRLHSQALKIGTGKAANLAQARPHDDNHLPSYSMRPRLSCL